MLLERIEGVLLMSDTPEERRSNLPLAQHARGHVLIAGLGLGMVLPVVLAKVDVWSVTVLEINPDVIALIHPHYQHEKLSVVQGDACAWLPPNGQHYDTQYFDVWSEQSTDTIEDMRVLHARFRKYRSKGAWVSSWNFEQLKYDKRRHIAQARYEHRHLNKPNLQP